MWSRDILEEGLLWKIGNGETINTRNDKWIPECASGSITSNLSYDNNMKVADFLLHSDKWNLNKLKTLFLPYEVDVILKIPLTRNRPPDSRFWKFDKKGIYTVKSGYWNYINKCNIMNKNSQNGICSSSDPFWNKIWDLIYHRKSEFLFGK